jgi:uncharacterized protein YrrD
MTKLVRARDLIGRPVVTLSGGDDIAEVKDVVYDPASHELVGFTLNQRGWFRGRLRELLPADALAAIGDTAVMVADDGALTAPEDAPDDLKQPVGARDVLGDRVITEAGVDLGAVSDVVILLGDQAEAVGYELSEDAGGRKFIPIDAQTAVSGEQLLVPTELSAFIREDLSDFGAAVDAYRSSRKETT